VRIFCLILVFGLLAACKDSPQMNGEAVDVSSSQVLAQYWLLVDDVPLKPSRFSLGDFGCGEVSSNLIVAMSKPTAFIDVEFLVDSTGKRFGEDIIAYSDDEFTKELVNFAKHTDEQLSPLSGYNFTASPSNAELTPVVVTETLVIESGTEVCKTNR